MAIRSSRTAYLSFPARQWLHVSGRVLMVACAATLLIMSKTGNPSVERLRTHITDVLVPVLAVAASPMDAFHDVGVWLRDMTQLRADNIRLTHERDELLQWQAAAKDMEIENRDLRGLLNVVPTRKNSFVTAYIVADSSGPYVRSALLAGGSDEGIKKDRAVIGENGLVGRVVDSGRNSARVLLLSDINSRVPVIAEHAQEKTILVGNNTGLPTLAYLAADSKIAVGDRILTSGDGGVFPQDIPVGVVTGVDKGTVTVQPFADPSKVDYVSVVSAPF